MILGDIPLRVWRVWSNETLIEDVISYTYIDDMFRCKDYYGENLYGGLKMSFGLGTSVTYTIDNSADDSQVTSGSNGYSDQYMAWGDSGGTDYSAWTRYNISVTDGATITLAKQEVLSTDSWTAGFTTSIAYESSDDCSDFTTTPYARSVSGTSVDWTTPSFSAVSWYNTTDFDTLVQEFIDRAGYADTGSHICIRMNSSDAATDEYYQVTQYDYGPGTYPPSLHIDYYVGDSPPESGTFNFESVTFNKSGLEHEVFNINDSFIQHSGNYSYDRFVEETNVLVAAGATHLGGIICDGASDGSCDNEYPGLCDVTQYVNDYNTDFGTSLETFAISVWMSPNEPDLSLSTVRDEVKDNLWDLTHKCTYDYDAIEFDNEPSPNGDYDFVTMITELEANYSSTNIEFWVTGFTIDNESSVGNPDWTWNTSFAQDVLAVGMYGMDVNTLDTGYNKEQYKTYMSEQNANWESIRGDVLVSLVVPNYVDTAWHNASAEYPANAMNGIMTGTYNDTFVSIQMFEASDGHAYVWEPCLSVGKFTTDETIRVRVNITDNSTVMNFVNLSIQQIDGGSWIVTNQSMNYVDGFWEGLTTISTEGEYSVKILGNDTSGELSIFRYSVLTIEGGTSDTTPPVITIVSPTNITYSNLPINLNVTLNENGNACLYNLDGGTNTSLINDSMTNWFVEITGLSGEDTKQLYVYCNDTVGNMALKNTLWFSYDDTEPYYYDNSTSSTEAGTSVTFKLRWNDGISLDECIAEWCDGGYNSGTGACAGGGTYDLEGWEDGWGNYDPIPSDWGISSGPDTSWTRYNLATPSANTGPDSAYEGSYYAYAESSGNGVGYPNKKFFLLYETPVDFDTGSMNVDFWYHMWGATEGSLHLMENSTGSWVSRWSLSGDQGNSWKNANVDLSGVSGTGYIMFNYTSGSSYTGDCALDYIEISGGGWVNRTAQSITGTEDWCNFTETITSTVGTKVGWREYGSDTKGHMNLSETFWFTTTSTTGDYDINWSYWTGTAWVDWLTTSNYLEFYAPSLPQTSLEPTNQDASGSQCIWRICHNGTKDSVGTLKMNVTKLCTGINLNVDDDYTPAGTTTLSTGTAQSISTLDQYECKQICVWADYDNNAVPCYPRQKVEATIE